MDRSDIPATLRGHRSTLFGNLAKLRDFHQDQLLPELERSHQFAHRIAPIFLRHVSWTFRECFKPVLGIRIGHVRVLREKQTAFRPTYGRIGEVFLRKTGANRRRDGSGKLFAQASSAIDEICSLP